jgi:2,4-dienoyl-CoA reductase-like NADH-dependent reductase (Old Yellow Enzyme family)
MPLMVTGGFRSREGMEAALASGALDVIGLARPFCTHPDCARELLERPHRPPAGFRAGLHLAAARLALAGQPASC